MKDRRGFTLVELLVTMVIIGIITGMSWPMLRRIQESNKLSKYEKYGESLIAAAKLYVDSYEEDIFYYEDDLTEAQKNAGQCGFITFAELKEHALIKDYNVDGISCNSDGTYVRVKRKKGNYTYEFFLGCGNKKTNGSKLTESEVYFTLPEQNHYTVPDYASCGSGVTEYRITYHSEGGSHCTNKIGHQNESANITWGALCNPTRTGYTFKGWKTAGGAEITASTVITSDIDVYAEWRINKIYIKLNTNGGYLADPHGASYTTVGDMIQKNGNDIIHEMNYGGSLTADGILNYNNPSSINIKKIGYHGIDDKEWNTKADGSGKDYNQTVAYQAEAFCDASAGDCTVILYANWKANKVYIHYNANGGTITDPHGEDFTQEGNVIKRKGSENVQTINYGGSISDLFNYNNPEKLNLKRVGYHAEPATAWNTSPDGSGTSYNQVNRYYSFDFCNADEGDCTVTIYVKWVINKVNIRYDMNGGTLLLNHGSSYTASGTKIQKNDSFNVQTINYGGTLEAGGLENYNDPNGINIGKVGYHAEQNAIWNTKADGTGTSYDQTTSYHDSDFCAATYKNCTVTLYPKWEINKIRIIYDLNGGTLKNPHGQSITTPGSTILNEGNRYAHTMSYGDQLTETLWDYNDSSWLNAEKTGCFISEHTEWNTQMDGNGTPFDQAYSYSAINFCDATYSDCERVLYLNWIC